MKAIYSLLEKREEEEEKRADIVITKEDIHYPLYVIKEQKSVNVYWGNHICFGYLNQSPFTIVPKEVIDFLWNFLNNQPWFTETV